MVSAKELKVLLGEMGESTEGSKAILEMRYEAMMSSQAIPLKPRLTNKPVLEKVSSAAKKATLQKKSPTAKKLTPVKKVISKPTTQPKRSPKAATVTTSKAKAPLRVKKTSVPSASPKKVMAVASPVAKKKTPVKASKKALGPELSSGWVVKKQLGKPGKEGTCYLVTHSETGESCAMKEFKPKKADSTFNKEVAWQRKAAQAGAAPAVRGVMKKPLRVVMQTMSRTLGEVLVAQDGSLTKAQQKVVICPPSCGGLDFRPWYYSDLPSC